MTRGCGCGQPTGLHSARDLPTVSDCCCSNAPCPMHRVMRSPPNTARAPGHPKHVYERSGSRTPQTCVWALQLLDTPNVCVSTPAPRHPERVCERSVYWTPRTCVWVLRLPDTPSVRVTAPAPRHPERVCERSGYWTPRTCVWALRLPDTLSVCVTAPAPGHPERVCEHSGSCTPRACVWALRLPDTPSLCVSTLAPRHPETVCEHSGWRWESWVTRKHLPLLPALRSLFPVRLFSAFQFDQAVQKIWAEPGHHLPVRICHHPTKKWKHCLW